MRKFKRASFFVFYLLLFASQSAFPVQAAAAEESAKKKVCAGDACFEKSIVVDGVELPLQGVALFEYWGFDVYSSAFYAPAGTSSIDQALDPKVPKYLVNHYHRKLERQNIEDNSEHILKENPKLSLSALRDRLKVLYKSYTDVKEGDKYAMTYLPGKGTKFTLNGKETVVIEGGDFQKAYFGIWLSRHSVDEDFTKKLLGQRK